ncbi:Probable dimethyladenosine transferase [Desulfurococcus amylolyticus 1221n]|uniref:Probable dimethyladenosine transferase n=1 Tax=Desulfurococcus amylolyticus (strain DSM 18924 / JCM 16383 / VKM B-2413 / 1221n) TaxID=490899 RepID=B8D6K0_DESA1|nr:16S rRNA (adenine(1518)-N(6)/adenine(1519)-N(6))-dimethyltransferase RsmA [Desulfurococcus amylolyticus]ACL11731.1 Probable dimethyladenosine transferase [Desulfurococcus amylolyticus 1221n]
MGSYIRPDEMSRRGLLSWTISILREHGLRPRRKLSQNFIVDPRLIRDFISHVNHAETTEIGCGLGTLTIPLSRVVPRLICIEIDEKLLGIAVKNLNTSNTLFINADATKYTVFSRQVVGNIPYHVTSNILVSIARSNNVERVVFTLQKDVAERLVAKPGSKQYGRITILLNTLFNIEITGIYGPSSFYPEPKVGHAIITLTRRRVFNQDVFALEKLTRLLFTQRRRIALRVLTKSLGIGEDSEIYMYARELLGDKRVYEVSGEVYATLARRLRENGLL